jgi:hypothetical protein
VGVAFEKKGGLKTKDWGGMLKNIKNRKAMCLVGKS